MRHFLEKVVSVEGLVELSGVIDESLSTWDDLVKQCVVDRAGRLYLPPVSLPGAIHAEHPLGLD